MSLFLLLGQTAPVLGNPTGGDVVSGSAAIGAAGSTLTVNQSTQNAIINWQTFSIASGETTKFIVPNSASATLNRVVGGNPSAIYGNLQSNGILYLVNPSGIVVGPSGRIDTAGFLASTLDVSNQQFLAGGNMSFAGSSDAAINNAGVVHASTGDVYLIANQVNNTGTLSAPHGTVGLAAGSDILFQQAGSEHLFVQATPSGTKRATGVTNSGTIRAAAAELKAAGGNAYALAINNTGVIAATGYKKIHGQVYLTSDGGSITNSGKISAKEANGNGGKIVIDGTAKVAKTSGVVTNSGTLDASATVAAGKGGTISVKDMTGRTVHSGSIFAKGGQGGVGGSVEVSGGTLSFTGMVDLTAPGGKTGTLLLDPATLDVVPGFGGNIVSGQNDPNQSTIGAATIDDALATANVTLNADTSITIDGAIIWQSGNTLTISTNTAGSTLDINKAIGATNGGLTISMAGYNDSIIAPGNIEVNSFLLESGSFFQGQAALANGVLPIFSANDFEILGQSSFMRTTGGDGLSADTPYLISDVYGLQGIGSPSGNYLTSYYQVTGNIDASGTAAWNSGAGFTPINDFSGGLDGQGYSISGLTINRPDSSVVAPFGYTYYTATIQNLSLTNVLINGGSQVAGFVANNGGTISNVTVSGAINSTGGYDVGGLTGENTGTISGSSNAASVTVTGSSGSFNIGGVAGFNSGSISESSNTGTITQTGTADGIGGLVGFTDNGSVYTSSNSGSVFAGPNSIFVGGLEGVSIGPITSSFNTGTVTAGANSNFVGGLEGSSGDVYYGQTGAVGASYNTGSVVAGDGSINVGGLLGYNFADGPVTESYNTGTVSGGGGGNSTGSNPPPSDGTPPSTETGGASDGGSNIVPPVLVPQLPQILATTVTSTIVGETVGSTPQFNFTGSGISQVTGQEDNSLAGAGGNSGQVGSGDGVQLGGGQLNNVSNPHASGALNLALGPVVYQNLSDAMKAIGDWADVPDSTSDEVASNNDGGETILSGGDVAEMSGNGTKKIPADQAPLELRNAMNTEIAGLGH